MSLTLLLLIDGFSYKYLSPEVTPFISSLTSNAIYGAVQPSGFFTCTSIYSGIYPERHHHMFMYGYDPEKSPFKRLPPWALPLDKSLPPPLKNIFRLYLSRSLAKRDKISPTKFASIPLEVSPFFRQFNPLKICPYPFLFDLLKDNHIQTVWDARDYSFSHKKYMGNFLYTKLYGSHFLKWLKENIKRLAPTGCQEQGFIFIEFPSKIDKLGHIYGPDSDEVKNEIRKVDKNLSSIFNFISKFHKDFFFGIVSDHGMTKVSRYWDISKCLKKLDLKSPQDYVYFLDATCGRFWFRNSQIKDNITRFLNQFSSVGKVLTSTDLEKARLHQDHIWGELIFAVEPGILILPNFLQGKKPYRGMHGYFENTLPELQCMFLLYNKSLSPKSAHMRLADIAPTILKIFGMPPPQFYQGVSGL